MVDMLTPKEQASEEVAECTVDSIATLVQAPLAARAARWSGARGDAVIEAGPDVREHVGHEEDGNVASIHSRPSQLEEAEEEHDIVLLQMAHLKAPSAAKQHASARVLSRGA